MLAREKEQTAAEKLSAMARECLAEHDGNTTKAISALVVLLLSDRALLRELVAPIVLAAVDTHVDRSTHYQRKNLIISVNRQSRRSDMVALAGGIAHSMLDFTLGTAAGIRLRDATREQVVGQAEEYTRQGNSMLRNARWLELIAQGVPADRKVGEVLTDARANELWEQVNAG